MSNLKIKFSHDYPKLWKQTEGKLIYVGLVSAVAVQANKALIEYDTKFYKDKVEVDNFPFEYYQLPKEGELIHLIFLGNLGIPFCTLRKYDKEKWEYYTSNKGKPFNVVIG